MQKVKDAVSLIELICSKCLSCMRSIRCIGQAMWNEGWEIKWYQWCGIFPSHIHKCNSFTALFREAWAKGVLLHRYIEWITKWIYMKKEVELHVYNKWCSESHSCSVVSVWKVVKKRMREEERERKRVRWVKCNHLSSNWVYQKWTHSSTYQLFT